MAASRPIFLFATILLLFTALTSAFPWPKFLPDVDSLIVRQNINRRAASQTASSSSPSQTAATSASASTAASASASGSISGSTSGTATSGSGSKTGSSTKTSKTSKTSYDARLPAGGIELVTPAATTTQYYKIGNDVTFAWNYTSLSATPTAINILASCSINSELYTIAMNQSIDVTSVVWDTGSYQSTAAAPFPVATYTLIIYDAESSISAVAQAGYLAVYDSYTFGMYTPQPYTPLNEFKCATCSGAMSSMEKNVLGFMFGMGAVTVLSFSWFIGGLNVIW